MFIFWKNCKNIIQYLFYSVVNNFYKVDKTLVSRPYRSPWFNRNKFGSGLVLKPYMHINIHTHTHTYIIYYH